MDKKTPISLRWDQDILWVNIGEYGKKLTYSQVEICRLLLQHILKEKIEFATAQVLLNENKIPNFSDNSRVEVVEEREGF